MGMNKHKFSKMLIMIGFVVVVFSEDSECFLGAQMNVTDGCHFTPGSHQKQLT